MKKAVFIDRDGVIIEDRNYAHKVQDLTFIPHSLTALRTLSSTDLAIIIVTNQSGIARGIFTEEEYHAFTDYLLVRLKDEGVRIDAVYYCPHHPREGVGEYRAICECRKPGIAMLEKAASEFNIDLKGSWLVGDKISDIKAGADAGTRTVLVATGYGGKDTEYSAEPDFRAADLNDAIDIILKEMAT